MHTLYAHQLHKMQERELFQAAEQVRLVNSVTRARRRSRLTRSPRQEKNATNMHQARNLAPL